MGIGRDIVYGLGAAASSPAWGASLLRTGKWRSDWAGRFGRGAGLDPKHPGRKRLLIHAVSVGEVNATRRLVAHLTQRHLELDLVIAATTNTGFTRARELYADRHRVVRYPLDFSGSVRRFLDRVRPDAVALMELEVWPNFVEACDQRGIAVGVINGRLSAKSFRAYRRLRPVLASTFAKLAPCGVQSEAYAERFRAMGATDVRVLDTMKWDTAEVADHIAGADALAAAMGIDRGRPVVVAGSTGPGEEATLLAAREQWPAGTQLVLAPRKPERFDEVARLSPRIVRRTVAGNSPATSKETANAAAGDPHSGQTLPEDKPAERELAGEQLPREVPKGVFLLDTLGELRRAYALADVVVVGRSFNGLGGSDPIEPIALGKPAVIGPDHANFAEVVRALEDAGGIAVVSDVGASVGELLRNPKMAASLAEAGRGVILSRQGVTARHAELVLQWLVAEG